MVSIAPCVNPPSAARVFVQLSQQHWSPAASASTLRQIWALSFLLPPRASSQPRVQRRALSSRKSDRAGIDVLLAPRRRVHTVSAPPQQRAFSTTLRRYRTETIYNPQKDEDGNEMKLEITPRAAKRLAEVMAKDGNPRLALRIQVESGGCHGFQYLMSLVSLPESLPTGNSASSPPEGDSKDSIREDDTIFAYDFSAGGATTASPEALLSAPKIILDGPSLELLKGSKVDFTMELIGSQFKVVDNPLASSSCGCGTSFDIKI